MAYRSAGDVVISSAPNGLHVRSGPCDCPPFLCVVPGKRGWPIAVLSDDFVYLCHVTDGLIQGHNDSLVVAGVFVGQFAALAVFQPFLADLVAANVEVPDRHRHASEVLRRVNPDAPVLVVVLNLLDSIRSLHGKLGDQVIQFW